MAKLWRICGNFIKDEDWSLQDSNKERRMFVLIRGVRAMRVSASFDNKDRVQHHSLMTRSVDYNRLLVRHVIHF